MFDAAFTPKRRTVLLSLAGIPVLLSACAKTTDDGGGSGGGGDAEGALTVGTTDKVTALDPAAAYDNGSSTVWTQVYGYLMNTKIGSEDGKPEPDLAESAEFTSDNIYTVTLQEGLTFANGNELTSEDVKHTFDRQLKIADPNGPSSLLGNLEKV
ncbi:MAG: ABC transporter substrate-binding protein, partial [Brachybacterium tyrofermentans]